MKARIPVRLTALLSLVFFGCSAVDKSTTATSGLIATPVSYYSSVKARLLGEKYKANLDDIVGKIAHNPKTVGLQFANNIASVGGIGFFTHSAATIPDARYLEVVLAAPELFETASAASNKFQSLFARYGYELLTILLADAEMYEDRDISGYGLNLSWRKVSSESGSPRVAVERAVAYFTKAQARAFVRREMAQADLLKNAVMFAGSEDGSMALVSLLPQETPIDFRPAIFEEDLTKVAKPEPKPDPVKAAPPPVKAPAMPAPEKVRPLNQPSEPMIVVMKAEPAAKTTPPNDSSKTVAPPPKMPMPERSPGISNVPAPVIVMLPPVAPKRAEVEARPEGSADAAVPASPRAVPQTARAVAGPASADTESETRRTSQQDIPLAKVEAAAPMPARQMPSPAPPPSQVVKLPETKEAIVQASKNERLVLNEGAAAAPLPATPSAFSKSAPVSAPPPTPPAATIIEQASPKPAVLAAPTQPVAAPLDEHKIAPVVKTVTLPAPSKTPTPGASEATAPVDTTPIKAAPEQLASSTQPARELPQENPVTRASNPPPAAPPAPSPVSAAAAEPLASLPKAEASAAAVAKSLPRPVPKPLAGYIVQIAFNDAGAARRWAEGMERKGFAISVTEAGEPGAVRVRLGNFAVRADAERQLVALRQEGLRGIVLNLPQAFLPEAASMP